MSTQAVLSAVRARHRYVRYYVLVLILLVTAVNLGDRANLSIAGAPMAKELGLSSVTMGYVFSAFAWAYVIGQLPGGWLLDRFNSIKVYGAALFLWSFFTFLQGYVGFLPVTLAIGALFACRFLVGLVEAPIYPANNYIVAAWFPLRERGLATSIFSSAQYVAVVLFVPVMGILSHALSWHWVFWFMGSFGMLLAGVWFAVMRAPDKSSKVTQEELDYLRENGAMIDIEANKKKRVPPPAGSIKVLLRSRMMAGVYLGQYCITSLQYFFITWFPIYLVRGRGMDLLHVGFVATLPAICGFVGSVLGGWISDRVLKSGGSVTAARKIPFVSGMLLASLLVLCNFTDSTAVIVALMSLALFGKGLAQIGLAVVVDTAPPEIVGIAGGLFGVAGNIAGIVTPIAIGYILAITGSFTGAMYFVGTHALVGALSYLFIVGKLKRLKLPEAVVA
ncbi:MFS transporter [Caballeronia sp. LZ032]|uniref:MFS transporter n=1 Tax=Caballeronia sp. LZ032 TaxID=3038565 RepID=UPI00285D91CC|nr:MFS transporter [Caballeronia sp. LZ032]MDR5879943.1 MFS transporter [Caballeronia sp. LZ032]